jgi:hypothetical protein
MGAAELWGGGIMGRRNYGRTGERENGKAAPRGLPPPEGEGWGGGALARSAHSGQAASFRFCFRLSFKSAIMSATLGGGGALAGAG